MKVLVCGGAGFAGSALIPKLLDLGHEVSATLFTRNPLTIDTRVRYMEADLTFRQSCNSAVTDQEAVFMLAGVSGGSGKMALDPMSFVTPNVLLYSQMFRACSERGVKQFITLSSTTGYPDSGEPMLEEDYFTGEPHAAYFNPGHTRRFIERLGAMYPALAVTFLRPANIYGPGDDYDPVTSHAIAANVRKVAERQDPLTVWGSGQEVREAIYVDDVVRALLLSLNAPAGAYNLGLGHGMSIDEIVDLLCQYRGYQPMIHHDNKKPTQIKRRLLNVSKAKAVLRWEASISMKDGLRDTLDWYLRLRGNG